ncbi:polysaccharide export protein Wza [Saccharophagus sp. K07]|uniref:polysaccharide export protein n=1 Tax=Saccharophagus sp. K07 TaxID=2283636 RepID=UPI0016526D29|nr:polysaccharide export protein [Saccharophagus sp. K07]MBC6904357.1 polysaccharide export protein Wza [Saccharophagus sp. K07]
MRLLTAVLMAACLTACVSAPGGHIRYKAKSKSENLNAVVDIVPIDLGLVERLRAEKLTASSVRHNIVEPSNSRYDYLIGPGDILSVIVYDHPELTIPAGNERSAAESGNVVHSDGTIFYPYIGIVDVAGRTTRDVRSEIQQRLSRFIADPQVEVKVAEFNARKAYVTGQVVRPGALRITNVPIRILDALSAAGGLTPNANWHELILTRNGKEERLSAYQMLTLGDRSRNYLLQDGDVLHVPDAVSQQIHVMGEVNRPLAIPMGNSRISLTNAIAQAGGIREGTANASGIFVVRRNSTGSDKFATVYQLNARNAAAFVLGSEFILQPTDVVYVTAAPVSRWNRVLSQLLPSLSSVYQFSQIGRNVDTLTNGD